MELREKLNQYAAKKGYDIDDNSIREILTEGESLKESNYDKHRWYTTYIRVVKIDDIFIEFQTYTNSGDEQALDDGEWTEMVLTSMKEVHLKKIEITDYI